MDKFVIGDRVRNINKYESHYGIGTIIQCDEGGIAVEYDNEMYEGHDAGGKGKLGHCWYSGENYLVKIADTPEERFWNEVNTRVQF